jgi:hypothetical protein
VLTNGLLNATNAARRRAERRGSSSSGGGGCERPTEIARHWPSLCAAPSRSIRWHVRRPPLMTTAATDRPTNARPRRVRPATCKNRPPASRHPVASRASVSQLHRGQKTGADSSPISRRTGTAKPSRRGSSLSRRRAAIRHSARQVVGHTRTRTTRRDDAVPIT